MLANDSFHIAVIAGRRHRAGGDGARARGARARWRAPPPGSACASARRRPAPATIRRPASRCRRATVRLCEEADAILLGACGLPHVRYPDNTEIMPQVELRFIFDLYAGRASVPARPRHSEPDRGRGRARHRSGGDPRIDRGPVRIDGQGRGHRGRGARDAGDHPANLASACSSSRSASRRGGKRARPARPARLRRQGQRVQGLRVLPPAVRRMRGAPSRGRDRAALRRRLRGACW